MRLSWTRAGHRSDLSGLQARVSGQVQVISVDSGATAMGCYSCCRRRGGSCRSAATPGSLPRRPGDRGSLIVRRFTYVGILTGVKQFALLRGVSTPLFKERNRRAHNSRLTLQVLHRRELAECGRRIKAGREQTQCELKRIAAFLPGARHAGITMAEISQLTGLSRPTLYQLQSGQAADGDREVTISVLSALGGLGPQTSEQLAGVTKIAEGAVAQTLTELVARELVSAAIAYYTPATPTAFLMLTEAGAQLLQTLLARPD